MSAPAKHTPGPWIAKPDEVLCGSEEICRAPLVVCLDGLGCEAGPRWQANARLIAEAPNLLAALRKAETWIATFSDQVNNPTGPLANDLAEIRAAIARATGQPSA